MEDKNVEMMKKIIESKKEKSSNQGLNLKPNRVIGEHRKGAKSNKKSGGVTDK